MPWRVNPSGLPSHLDEPFERSEVEITRAVQECARLCSLDDDPQECAREYVATLFASGWSAEDAEEVLIGGLFGLAESTPTATASVQALLEGLRRTFMYDQPQSITGPHIASQDARSRELPFACISMIALTLGAVSLFLPALTRWPM